MNERLPEYHLTRILADGTVEPPEVYPFHAPPGTARISRRGFVGSGVAIAGLLGLTGCREQSEKPASVASSGPTPLRTPRYDESTPVEQPRLIESPPPQPTPEPLPSPRTEPVAPVTTPTIPSRPLRAHRTGIRNLTFDSDSKRLISQANDGEIKVWVVPDGKLASVHGRRYLGTCLKMSATHKLFGAEAFGNMQRVLNLDDGKSVLEVRATQVIGLVTEPKLTAFYRLGRAIESRTADKMDADTSRDYFDDASAGYAVIDPVGKHILLTEGRTALKLFDAASGRKLWQRTPKADDPLESALAVDLAGKRIAWSLTYADRAMHVTSIPDGREIHRLEGHLSGVRASAFSPNMSWLASGDDDGAVIIWDLDRGKRLGYLFDPAANDTDGVVHQMKDTVTGQTITFTLPCGSPIPPGATCVCNCVPGTYRAPPPAYTGGGGGGFRCTCNRICTCIPVCQAHQLCHADDLIRRLAQGVVLGMGCAQLPYLAWARNRAPEETRLEITRVMTELVNGRLLGPGMTFALPKCSALLRHDNAVVRIMAAQALASAGRIDDAVIDQLALARERAWPGFEKSRV